MKSKFRRLERRWGNVGERISEDALSLHNTFTELVKKTHWNIYYNDTHKIKGYKRGFSDSMYLFDRMAEMMTRGTISFRGSVQFYFTRM